MTSGEVRAYLGKAEEYLAAAEESLEAKRSIAATSLAIHSAINAADAVTGARLGKRAAGQDHNEALTLLSQVDEEGPELAKHLARLLPLKTRAEYEPDEIPESMAEKAVGHARKCMVVARRVLHIR